MGVERAACSRVSASAGVAAGEDAIYHDDAVFRYDNEQDAPVPNPEPPLVITPLELANVSLMQTVLKGAQPGDNASLLDGVKPA